MDPVTAVALAFKAACELVTEMARGQTPEQRAQLWAWFIEDQQFWRALLAPHHATDVPKPSKEREFPHHD
jgi:hypothetical protein